jgi:hypothetical protein
MARPTECQACRCLSTQRNLVLRVIYPARFSCVCDGVGRGSAPNATRVPEMRTQRVWGQLRHDARVQPRHHRSGSRLAAVCTCRRRGSSRAAFRYPEPWPPKFGRRPSGQRSRRTWRTSMALTCASCSRCVLARPWHVDMGVFRMAPDAASRAMVLLPLFHECSRSWTQGSSNNPRPFTRTTRRIDCRTTIAAAT